MMIYFCLKSRNNNVLPYYNYQRACDFWKVFEIENLGQYDLYLKTDVLFLCDVFEKFINVCLVDYGLDPCHYFSLPGVSWDAMLKMTGVKLEKIDNIDIHLLKGMRGGVSSISKRFSKSSNDKTIIFLDMNNLYGTVMSFNYLPYGDFKFLREEEIKVFNSDRISENSLIGYLLQVDVEYCRELHDLHIFCGLIPTFVEVTEVKLVRGACLAPILGNVKEFF